jgi:hypothetical protein
MMLRIIQSASANWQLQQGLSAKLQQEKLTWLRQERHRHQPEGRRTGDE